MNKIKEKFGKNKKIFIILGLVLILVAIFYIFQTEILFFINKDDNKIGWLTDIHAGANKKRAFVEEDGSENTLYPKKYKEYFPAVLKEMKRQGIRTVIVTGDSTNITEYHHARELKRMADEEKMKIVWVRGNHDFLPGENKDTMREFGVSDYFYSYDTDSSRIIVLDINFNGPAISKENMEWLNDRLSETELPVIVAMHTPIINYDTGEFEDIFSEVGRVILDSKKVKFVISGHTHKDRQIEKNGVVFHTAWPLTQKNHMGSHYILEIDKGSVAHLEIGQSIEKN